jgi:hypothetical protein
MQPSHLIKPRRRVAVGHAALARAVALMARRCGASTTDIAGETGLHVVTVRKLVAALCQHGAAHEDAEKAKDAKGRRNVRRFKLGAAR